MAKAATMQTVSELEAPPPRRALHAQAPLALFIDFDGTLVDIADAPDAISVPADLAERLAKLAQSIDHALALVSGRAIVDLERHLGRLQVASAGSHGIDRRHADGTGLGNLPQLMPEAAAARLREFAQARGLRLEAKPHGSALHYRSDPSLENEGVAFADALAAEHGLVVKRGKFVIELVRPGADKGGAVRAFMQVPPFAGRRPVFIGDDVTDEDGIIAVQEMGGIGIAVGDRQPTAALYHLPDTRAVHDWLGL
jgi:trehalose 6-phosphate phosphatase